MGGQDEDVVADSGCAQWGDQEFGFKHVTLERRCKLTLVGRCNDHLGKCEDLPTIFSETVQVETSPQRGMS